MHKTRWIAALLLLPTLASGMANADTRNLELKYLAAVVPQDLLSISHLEIPALESIAIGGQPNSEFLELSMFPGQSHTNGGN